MKDSHPEGDHTMRRIRMRCTACGEVLLSADEITMTETHGGERVTCTFSCPGCDEPRALAFDVVAGRMLPLTGTSTRPEPVGPLTEAHVSTLYELMDRPDFVSLMAKAA
jgi:hypothetical protein